MVFFLSIKFHSWTFIYRFILQYLRQVWYCDTWRCLLPSKNAIAFNKMIFNTIKFFEEYLIYGIKDKNKETWAFKLTYSLSRMIFNANAILHLQHTLNWNIPIHILEGYSMPCSLTAIFWPSSKHCQQKGKGKDSIDNKQLSINIVG